MGAKLKPYVRLLKEDNKKVKTYCQWAIRGHGRAHPRPWVYSAQSDSYLDSWGSGASGVFRQKTVRSSSPLQIQTEYLMLSWVGACTEQVALTDRQLIKISPPTGYSRRRRRKTGLDDARKITVTTARDFWSKS
ncbi:hypothetical protein PanWU01x14_358850 [Parasponia andersonii]|uniref:Uncharacterized protein n=1 Tax=Parasponia andersonii TaxID=3476 RepID=A0A2P5A871_PARAD|nr:hypothetical protein PanWU01x14_358850 [Parasponia andersonii]